MKLSAADLLAICPKLGARANDWVEPLATAFRVLQINTPARAAAFMAQAKHESADMTVLEENLDYPAATLLKLWDTRFDAATANDYARNPQRIANRVYGNRLGNGDEASGDGWRYRGRGIFQITGKDNYRECSIGLFADPNYLVDFPEAAATINVAAMSAAWYWGRNGLNDLADAGDFDGVCDVINRGRKTALIGDSNGYPHRVASWELAKDVLAA